MAEAIAELQRLFPDVHGRLVDLVEPTNGRYTTAMDVGMGRYGDAIVVETSEAAARCIEFLRERRVKPCLFLPMGDLRPKPRDSAFDHLGSAFRRLRDVMRADSRFAPALDYVCGNIIVANTLEDATEQRFKKGKETKFVTLDGVVIAKNGNMTGGASALDRAGSRRRVSEKELAGLRKRRDELLREEAVLRRRLGLGSGSAAAGDEGGEGGAAAGGDDAGAGAMDGTALREAARIRAQLQTLEARRTTIKADAERVTSQRAAKQAEAGEVRKMLADVRPKLAAAQAESQEQQEQIDTLAEEVEGMESGVFEPLCKRLGLGSIRDYEDTVLKRHEASEKRSKERQEHVQRLQEKEECDADRCTDLEKRRDAALEAAEQADKAASKAGTAADKAKAAADAAEELLLKRRQAVDTAREEVQEQEDKVRRSRERRALAGRRRAEAAKAHHGAEAQLQKGRAQRHDLLTQLELDQVVVPLKEEDGEDEDDVEDDEADEDEDEGRSRKGSKSRGGSQAASASMDDEGMETGTSGTRASSSRLSSARFARGSTSVVRRDADRASRIDFDKMMPELLAKARASDLNARAVDSMARSLQEQIRVLRLKIQASAPNMKAGEQLEDVTKRLSTQRAETRTKQGQAEQVAKAFERVRKRRLKLFMDAYSAVRSKIDSVYKALTRSSKHVHGGQASLHLWNEEDPFAGGGIRYNVSPPGKHFRDMEQLSGGEKTVAALALLFAIHHYHPSPFFVLDEVDAALDNVNVHKVCHYI